MEELKYSVDLCTPVYTAPGRWAWRPLVHVTQLNPRKYKVSIHAILPGERESYVDWKTNAIAGVSNIDTKLQYNGKKETVWDIRVNNPMNSDEKDTPKLNWTMVAIQLTLNLPDAREYPVWVRYQYDDQEQKQGTLSYPVVSDLREYTKL